MQQIIVYAITAGSMFLLSLVTLATPRRVNIKANNWLAFFLFSFACILLDNVLVDTQVYSILPRLQGVLEITRFAIAPALYFSVIYFTTPDRKFQTVDYLHFIPFSLFALFIVLLFLDILDSPLFSWYDDFSDSSKRAIAIAVFSSLKIQMIVYWMLSYRQLLRHSGNISIFYSTLMPVSLSWLRYFLIGLALAILLSLNEVIQFIPVVTPVTHFVYLMLTFYLGYFSLRQDEIFPYTPSDVSQITEIIEPASKAMRHQRIEPSELEQVTRKLRDLMAAERVYLDPDLRLPELAVKMNMSTHDLSFVINEGFQENFFQFINRYRIDEAKRLLKSANHRHLNILGIAYECGFRSKSTFNETFKKLTGQSPSQFMKTDVGLDNTGTEQWLKDVRLDNSGRPDTP